MKEIYITIGYPGSGKSAYLRNKLALKPHVILCPDQIREELTGDMGDQSQNKRVFELFYKRLEEFIHSEDKDKQVIGLDATFLRKIYRTPVFETIKNSGIECQIYILEMGLTIEDSLERMQSRQRQVFKDVLERMQKQYTPLSQEEIDKYDLQVIKITKETPFFQQGNTAFIGDIQSCYNELEKLLGYLGFYQENGNWTNSHACKELIFLGDLTDRGPGSVEVLKTVMQLCQKGWARSVSGNHDNKLMRYLKGNPVKLAHGLEMTVQHLSILSQEEKDEILTFLQSLPTSIEVEIHGRKYVAVHACWQEWMKGKDDKGIRERNMYGVLNAATSTGGPKTRVLWWEDEKYLPEDYIIVFGHYATKVDLPQAKCVDWGCCFGQQLAAFIPQEKEDLWVSVDSSWDWNENVGKEKEFNVLTYNELFAKLAEKPSQIISDIEADPQINKRHYKVTHNDETFELTIANASKTLYDPSPSSYAHQLAKGIVYNRHTKEIVSVTLPKFYNYGEKQEINEFLHNLLDDNNYNLQFVEKLDGTQVARFSYKGKVFWNTRSVIISEPNPDIDSNLDNTDFYKFVLDAINHNNLHHYQDPNIHRDKTLIFELLHSDNLLTIPYVGPPKLSLLSYTQKDQDGNWEWQYTVHETLKDEFHLPEIFAANGTIEQASSLIKNLNDQDQLSEGFVANLINDKNQIIFRIKFKTAKFFEAMKLVFYCSYARVVETCKEHNLKTEEDFLNYLKKDKDSFPEELLEKYQEFYSQYHQYMNDRDEYSALVREFFESFVSPMVNSGQTRKEIAQFVLKYPFSSHLFNLLDNRPLSEEILDKYLKFEPEIAKIKKEEVQKLLAGTLNVH